MTKVPIALRNVPECAQLVARAASVNLGTQLVFIGRYLRPSDFPGHSLSRWPGWPCVAAGLPLQLRSSPGPRVVHRGAFDLTMHHSQKCHFLLLVKKVEPASKICWQLLLGPP